MSTRILHIADVHLERPFVGLPLDAARARRHDLRGSAKTALRVANFTAGRQGAQITVRRV